MSESFLLTWNPNNWQWPDDELRHAINSTAKGRSVPDQWSVGIRKQGINAGDRAFLVRQVADRGIVASGHFMSEIFEDKHWDGTGRPTMFAHLEWDAVVDPEDRLPVDALKASVPEVVWDRLQGSGVRVAAGEDKLERLWAAHLKGLK